MKAYFESYTEWPGIVNCWHNATTKLEKIGLAFHVASRLALDAGFVVGVFAGCRWLLSLA